MNSNKKLAAALAEFASDVEALEDFANDLIDPVNPTGGIADLLGSPTIATYQTRIKRAIDALEVLEESVVRGAEKPSKKGEGGLCLSMPMVLIADRIGKIIALLSNIPGHGGRNTKSSHDFSQLL